MKFPLVLALLLAPLALQAEELPTLLAKRGKLLVEQNFAAQPPPYVKKPGVGFASGFAGWRFNTEQRGGHWEAKEGTFQGVETPGVKHPATASWGFDFQNVVIQCELRMENVPDEGRPNRYMAVRTTDTKDYVCSVSINPKGWQITKDDNDHAGPDKSQLLGKVATPLALDEWHTVVFEIIGDEMVGTVDGKSLYGKHPLIASAKKSVMFVSGVQGSVRNFKVYEAEPNPEWPKHKATLPVPPAPIPVATPTPSPLPLTVPSVPPVPPVPVK